MRAGLADRAIGARELMDEPDADLRMLENTYRRFGAVNALVSRPGLIYRRDVRPRAAAGRGPLRILDVGAGGGDLCRYLVRRLRRDGLDADITALDADDRAIRWASANDAGAGVRYRCARTDDLVDAGEEYDVVVSNHVLHHLTDPELRAILRDSEQLVGANGLVSHHDIRRSGIAHALFAAGTWPFSRNLLAGSFIREDGLTSIRRSFTEPELAAIVPSGWSVRGGFPFRVELRWEGSDARP